MTFTSYGFLFAFVPIVVAGYHLIRRLLPTGFAVGWLVLASLVFYASDTPQHLIVLVASVLGNFLIVRLMAARPVDSGGRRALLMVGVVANLLLLGTYKYTGFLADIVNGVFGTHLTGIAARAPIGLSFYTFIQIGFLLYAYLAQGDRPTLLRYALFGTFFPYVTAGPIVRPDEVFGQIDNPDRDRALGTRLVLGTTMFVIGLFKKAVLADNIAPYATTLFTTASGHDTIGAGNAWVGMLAYTLQLYFDFSGYSDMAIGLAYLLGFRLPVNFNSPLRATNVVDFWRRWHITMTRFFTDYVYTPLATKLMRRSMSGGHSAALRVLLVLCLPVLVTFLLVGLWHGAGWGFVLWGAFQGVAMAINLIWRELATAYPRLPRIPGPVGWLLTMITFVTSLTFFQAPDLRTAWTILTAMYGFGPGGAPVGDFYGRSTLFDVVTVIPALLWVVVPLAIALLPRNSQQMLERYEVALPTAAEARKPSRFAFTWQPNLRWSVVIGLAAATALVFAGGPSPFLYYRF
jgi:D-alanyl-lipoteichoic acid acyltransferase DltB (MBOAT superfamily)